MYPNLFRNWLIAITSWIGVVYFYAFLTVFGLREFMEKNPITEYVYSDFFHLEVVLTGLILGTLFLLIHRVTDSPGIRRRSFGFNILLKSFLYILSLLVCGFIIYLIFSHFDIVSEEQFGYWRAHLWTWPYFTSVGLYFALAIFLMNFLLQVNRKFGPGVLFDLIRGKYYHPRQENLILLFIDLQNSTTIAESLGHERYSQFLRECIHELTPILVKNSAHVYQYVGDEIVLQWQMERGLDRLRFLDTYFDFKHRLDSRKDYFINRYGYYPRFKAGCDAGEVTVTEIGDVKREIALHGDVLNTAARLEKKCNEFERRLLVSENLVSQIASSDKYGFEFLSDIPLKGKRKSVKFFSVRPVG